MSEQEQVQEQGAITDEMVEALDLRALDAIHKLKKRLRTLSRNQLINIIFQQMNIALEQQEANKLLLNELNELKKGSNEKN